MADQYIDQTYVNNMIGSAVRTALFTDAGVYSAAALTATIEAATGVIQNAIRSAGYTAPATTTDQFIMLATLGELVWLGYNRPDKRLPLPEGWANSSMAKARAAILSGEAELDLPIDTTGATGGISSTDYSDSATGCPTIFHRHDMDTF